MVVGAPGEYEHPYTPLKELSKEAKEKLWVYYDSIKNNQNKIEQIKMQLRDLAERNIDVDDWILDEIKEETGLNLNKETAEKILAVWGQDRKK